MNNENQNESPLTAEDIAEARYLTKIREEAVRLFRNPNEPDPRRNLEAGLNHLGKYLRYSDLLEKLLPAIFDAAERGLQPAACPFIRGRDGSTQWCGLAQDGINAADARALAGTEALHERIAALEAENARLRDALVQTRRELEVSRERLVRSGMVFSAGSPMMKSLKMSAAAISGEALNPPGRDGEGEG